MATVRVIQDEKLWMPQRAVGHLNDVMRFTNRSRLSNWALTIVFTPFKIRRSRQPFAQIRGKRLTLRESVNREYDERSAAGKETQACMQRNASLQDDGHVDVLYDGKVDMSTLCNNLMGNFVEEGLWCHSSMAQSWNVTRNVPLTFFSVVIEALQNQTWLNQM